MTIDLKQKPNDAIVAFDFVYANEIASEAIFPAGKTSITLTGGALWKRVYFTPGTAGITSQVTNSFQGKIIESKFEMSLPGQSAELMFQLGQMCGRAVVVKLLMESGSCMICGGKTRKLRLSSSSVTGTSNGYVVGFEYRSKREFLWLNNEASGS